MCQYGYITVAFPLSLWGEINLEKGTCGGNEHKMCEERVEMGETE